MKDQQTIANRIIRHYEPTPDDVRLNRLLWLLMQPFDWRWVFRGGGCE